MKLSRVVILVNLAFVLGLLAGYVWWEREVGRLEQELTDARRAPPLAPGQSWTVQGIVRAWLPQERLLLVTHEPIPELMGAMTMAFRVADPALVTGVTAGDRVEFTMVRTEDDFVLAALRRQEPRAP